MAEKKRNGPAKEERDYGVVSAAVGADRAERIRRSAAARDRSVSYVVNEILLLAEGEYFKRHPLPGDGPGRRKRPSMAPAAPTT